MSNKVEVGNYEAHEKLTARLWITPLGETGQIDIGNISDYSNVQARELRTRMVAESGFRRINDEQLDTVGFAYEFTLDENAEYMNKLMALANGITEANQASASSFTETLTSVTRERSYKLSKRAISSLVVEVSAVTKTLGTDYTVNLDTGRITILGADTAGTILDTDDVDLTYDVADRGLQTWTGGNSPLFRATAELEEFNQSSDEPLRVSTGLANLQLTAFPEQSGEFATFTLRLLFTAKPVVVKRNEATTLTAGAAS